MGTVMGLLIFSFAIWGIGDIFRGFGRSTVVKIGNTEITIEQFRQMYNDRLQQVSRQFGRVLTPDQIRQLGLDRQVATQIITEMALDERARSLRLGMTDVDVANRVTADPNFQTPDGRFDRTRFEAILRQAGFTESRYVSEMRREAMRRQLAGTIIGPTIIPKAAVDAADRYHNEQRTIDYVLFDHAQAGEIDAPTPEALAKYFDERKVLFRAPEYRKIVTVSATGNTLAKPEDISDEDAKRIYDERRASFGTPETRQIQQIVFPNVEDAKAAAARITEGTSFADIAKERNLSEKDIDLGTMTKAAIIDKEVGDAAFALKEGEVSAPVQGRFGISLLHVVKIEPEKIKPFEEVSAEIKRTLASERARPQVLAIYDKIEDARSEGKTLAETGDVLKLPVRTVEVDRSGRDANGQLFTDFPDLERILPAAFTADAGVENDAVQIDGGYLWFEVAGTTPARDRTLDEVKDRVEARWREDEIATRLKAKATELLDKVKGGATLADAAAAQGSKVATTSGIKRSAPATPLSPAAVDLVFRTAKGAVASADAEQPGDQIVFTVTDIVTPKTDMASAEAKQMTDTLNRTMSDDVLAEYLVWLQSDLGVKINQSALRQVMTGVNTPSDDTTPDF